MEVETGDEKVVSIESARAEFGESWPIERKRSFRLCAHRQLVVDEETGSVECKGCDEEIDPIRALLLACRWFHEYRREFREIGDWKRSKGRLRVKPTEAPAVLDGRLHLLMTYSTGRLHAARAAHDGEAQLVCGADARVGVVEDNLRRRVVVGALRYGFGCSRCLKAIDLEASDA